MTRKVAYLPGSVLGLETGFKHPVAVKYQKPFGIGLVRLLLRDVFHLAGVAQLDIETVLLKLEELGNPIDSCRLHRDGLNAASLQPAADLVQVARKAPEAAIVVAVSVGWDAYLHLAVRYVYACCVRVHDF